MKILLSAALLFVLQAGMAQQASREDVLKVIELSGADASLNVAKNQIMKLVPADKQAAFIAEFDTTLPSVYDKIVKIYQEAYTKEDIAAMIAFYNSPVGKK